MQSSLLTMHVMHKDFFFFIVLILGLKHIQRMLLLLTTSFNIICGFLGLLFFF